MLKPKAVTQGSGVASVALIVSRPCWASLLGPARLLGCRLPKVHKVNKCACAGLFQAQLSLTSEVPAARFLSAGARQLAHSGLVWRRRHSMSTADFSAASLWDSQSELAGVVPAALMSAGGAAPADLVSAQPPARTNSRRLDGVLMSDAARAHPLSASTLLQAPSAAGTSGTEVGAASQTCHDRQQRPLQVCRIIAL